MSQFINFGSNPRMSSNQNKVMTQLSQLSQQTNDVSKQLGRYQQTHEEESDERKKFEKFRFYKMQQKRLQEMSFTKDTTNSSADHLINNIIERVGTDAKLNKRLTNASNKQIINPLVSSISASVMTPINQNMATYCPQYSNPSLNSVPQNMSLFCSTQPLMASVNQKQQQYVNQYQNNSLLYPQTLSLNTTPIVSQMSTNAISCEPNYSSAQTFNVENRTQNHYSGAYIPNTSLSQTSNQTTNAFNCFNFDSNAIQSSISETNPIKNSESHSSQILSVKKDIPLCFSDSSRMPSIYLQVWNYVQINEISYLCDTNKVYAVLLSGGLPQTLLAQVWTHVNNTIPGQLTRQELYMALALIALIQRNSSNPLQEVYKLDSLPIPNLQFFPNSQQPQNSQNFQSEKHENSEQLESKNNFEQKTIVLNDKISNEFEQISANLNIDVNNDDDFADFKSADFDSSQVPIQSNEFTPKQTSFELIASEVTNDDEFDDFKFATADESSIQKSIPFIETKTENESSTKTASLTDALFSNISAISTVHHNKDYSNSLSNSIPLISVTNNDNFGQNAFFEANFDSSELTTTTVTAESNSASVDKYSAFRELLTENNCSKSDDFGDFLSHAHNYDAESVDSLQFGHQDSDNDNIESIRNQIMQTCRQLIHKAFNVLVVNHGEESVSQAINTVEGKNFALDLLEVYGIAKRVWKSSKAIDKSNENLIKLMSDIENTWNTISSVFAKASLKIESTEENSNDESISSQCAICCSKPSSEQSLLTFASFEYHPSCANLWLNCINSTLPQPIINLR